MSTWLAAALSAAAMTAPAEPAPSVETIEYTIRKGDSCAKIATERYGSREHYEVIHQYNRWLGPKLPHRLQEGQVLILPKTLPPALPDAEVTAARRKVEARPPEASLWSNARPGLDLYRGWRVNTQERASAEITFRDYSRIDMRQNTLVIIYGGSRSRARRETTEATLDRGAVRARLGAYTGKSSDSEVSVTTPSAVAELDGGTSLVTVDDQGTSRVANHGTGKAKVRSKSKGGTVKVGPRMGSKVVKDARPTKPRPLPPTPEWNAQMATTFVAAGGHGTVRGEWIPEEGVARYRVELAKQHDGRELFASQSVPAGEGGFEISMPPGDYYVSVASVDDDEFESPPSAPVKVSVLAASLSTPGGAPLPEEAEDGPPTVLRGTRLDVPAGLSCSVEGGEPSGQPLLADTGANIVSCTAEEGGATISDFVIVTVDVEVAATEAKALERGETTSVGFSLESAAPLPQRVWVEAPEGFVAGVPVPAESAGQWTVPVHASPDAPPKASLRVMAESGGTKVELGEVELTVEDTKARSTDPTPSGPVPDDRPERHMLELGLFGGVMLPSPRHELYQVSIDPALPDVEHQPLGRVAPSLGVRLGYYPIRWVGVEMEHALMPTRTRTTQDRAFLYSIRGHVLGQLPWKVTPTAHAGVGILGITTRRALGRDSDIAPYFGVGVKYYPTRWAAIRLDLRDSVTAGLGNGFAHFPEILFGFEAVIGRRSAESPTGRRLRPSPPTTSSTEVSSAR